MPDKLSRCKFSLKSFKVAALLTLEDKISAMFSTEGPLWQTSVASHWITIAGTVVP